MLGAVGDAVMQALAPMRNGEVHPAVQGGSGEGVPVEGSWRRRKKRRRPG